MSGTITRVGAVFGTALALLAATALPAMADPSGPETPPGIGPKMDTLLSWGMWFVVMACIGGVLFCAAKLTLAFRHGEGAESAKGLAGVGVACVLVGAAAPLVRALV